MLADTSINGGNQESVRFNNYQKKIIGQTFGFMIVLHFQIIRTNMDPAKLVMPAHTKSF